SLHATIGGNFGGSGLQPQNDLISIRRDYEPGITATIQPLKPEITANEPAFILVGPALLQKKIKTSYI
ncbi:MAG: hypothetical protein ABI865_07975, partial [Nitrosospira sp.]